MSVETNAKFISEFNEAYPRKGDLIKEGDDHMRLIKSVLKNTLPGLNRTVNFTSEKLNQLDSLTSFTDDTLTFKGNLTVSDKKKVNLGGNVVSGISDPLEDTDAVNKQYLKKEGMGFAWPVDSIYITMDSRNPKDIFGFGEWEKFANGRVLIGSGSDKDANEESKLIAVNAKGGTYNETLKENHIPAHKHKGEGLTGKAGDGGSHSHRVVADDGSQSWGYQSGAHGATSGGNFDITGMKTDSSGTHSHSITIEGETATSGGGQKHNNMMPYIGVNIWRRLK